MNVSLNIGADFVEVIDGLEPVTLTSRAGVATAVANALRTAERFGETNESDGKVTQADLFWHWSVSEVPTQPEVGATVTDASGEIWTILEVRQETQSQRWQIKARNLTVALGLDTLITIQQASFTKDAHGGSQAQWSDWKPSVRAKIQPIESRPTVKHDTSTEKATHVVLLIEDLALEAHHRIVDGDNRLYRIEKIQKADRLGQPTEIFVRQETWP